METIGRDELERLQLERLQALVPRLAMDVPFYRESLENVDPPRSLEELASLPFTTKQTLRDHYPFGLLAVPRERILRVHASSGTTGKPTVVAYTEDDMALWGEVMARLLTAGGVTSSDLVHNAYGYGLFTGGLGFGLGAETVSASTVPASGGHTARHIMLIEDFGATVLFSGECSEHRGLHIAEDHFLAEVVDPESGEPLSGDAEGELVLTTLTKQGLPLLRYRTRDLVRLNRERCACGRTSARMSKVLGRTDDMLIVRGVNVFPTQIEQALLSVDGLAPQYVILVDRGQNRLDDLEIQVEALEAASDEAVVEIQKRAKKKVEETLGIRVKLRVVPPKELERSQGKAVRVVDRRED